ncbi:Ni,Fe-hydrogenase III large subunit [Thermoclostridium stercorarium subsp. stercorarium DSM 8532]|uniref:Ni,Fe-hydrogenase III large subunit n=3 Tax=Thermoclostridium stercorarium TaxID=1510 RepID=L7VMD7_THES1|nr:Ni,Fe-hydrogenase III large subunit [Thermoclostridium stercorarium]AGC69390.1 Ni,Fe-hydrogenase III large subunit [Thermoclostridium stercorarium subsp. stercorarium DSM 8532]AGI40349.1 NfhA [Thermoclostridium stercorarium subsp. stercorarium DSM 8532]ANW99643.1 Ni,Fe-hydrogenase III large subunit [Thermoclostridium stercorarium subsp. thermolacticum DSM 2910]ANX02269.1 Ni,Fe-hydrogenase III large subunit [Thermoclostridium stercorarium subsp. leptospartum DSM 9219]UZQ85347.1 Ni,Fe-hydroge
MKRSWNEKQGRAFMGKMFGYKLMGYRLVFIKSACDDGYVKLQYMLEKDGYIETVETDLPENGTFPSITGVFPEGAQMEREIAGTYPVMFVSHNKEHEKNDGLSFEWGPFHPLLQEPVLFRFSLKDDVIDKVCIETGYNYRGIERLCIGEKIPNVLDMLERISSVNGFSIGLAFLHAVEAINEIAVPPKANLLRLILNEMSFLRANLYSLSHITKCLGLLSDSSEIFKLISLYNEAALLITNDPQLKGILVPGGLSIDTGIETLVRVNVILQEMVGVLSAMRDRWNNTQSITERMKATGKIDKNTAARMTGRAARAAGLREDVRKLSRLPYHVLSYKIPTAGESNSFTRTMLIFEDILLSLSLIDQTVEIMHEGDIRTSDRPRLKSNGEILVREPEAFGELVIHVSLDEELVTNIKIRNSSTINFPFLDGILKGTELNDVPLVIASLDLDFSAMEK